MKVIVVPTQHKVPMAIWAMIRLGRGILKRIDFKYLEQGVHNCCESNDCGKCLFKTQCVKLYDDLKLRDKDVTRPNQ